MTFALALPLTLGACAVAMWVYCAVTMKQPKAGRDERQSTTYVVVGATEDGMMILRRSN